MTPLEFYNTFVDFNDDLEIDIYTCWLEKLSQLLKIFSSIFHNESFKKFL